MAPLLRVALLALLAEYTVAFVPLAGMRVFSRYLVPQAALSTEERALAAEAADTKVTRTQAAHALFATNERSR